MDKKEIIGRWTEYISELYTGNREEVNIHYNEEGPKILEAEVQYAIKQIKLGKATGPDNITKEEIEALGDFGIEVLTKLLNDVNDTGYIPKDLLKSVYIPLPKKPGTIDCENHRTISLMSHISKFFLKIILKRMQNKIKREIADEQCGFVEDSGTSNAIYILRTLTERSIEVQKDLYLCFIDYTKAFDKVNHEELIHILEHLNIDGKDLRIIKNLYWQQTAAIKVGNEIGPYQQITTGVRQGCVLSPHLFSLYSEIIMRSIEDMPGTLVGGYNINNLRYADDTVLIAESEKDLQSLVDKVRQESALKGLSLNQKKTEVMVISKKITNQNCKINVEGTVLNQVQSFKYLGTIITAYGRCNVEVKSRIAQAKSAFHRMKSILCNKSLSLALRKQCLQTYIKPILLYGSEAWTINKATKQRLQATEMWFLRRMMKISWTAKITNENVLKEANEKRRLITDLRKRQSKFIGHVLRKRKIEHLVTTGKILGKRDRGRQREKILDSLAEWHGKKSTTDLITSTKDRGLWRSMTANACGHGTR